MTEVTHRSLFGPALRGIFAALGSDVAQKVFGLASTLIILAAFSPYEYGLWQLTLSVLTAFDVFLFGSIASMLIAEVSREIGAGERGRAGDILVRAVPMFSLLGVGSALLMVFSAPLITQYSGIDLTKILSILSLALVAEGVMHGYQFVLQGSLALVHAQVLKVLRRFLYFGGVVSLVFLFGWHIEGVVYAYVASLVISALVYAPIVWPRFRDMIALREKTATPFIEAVWERGRWSFAGDVLAATTGALWPWIVGYYLGVAEVGYISLATLLIGQAASLAPISFVLRSILPRTLAVEGRTRAWLVRSMKYAVWSQLGAGIGVALLAAALIPVFFPTYVVVVPLVATLIITLPIRAVGVVASEWFFAARRQRALFFASSVPKAIILALLPLFLAPLGLFGFALWYTLSADLVTYLRLRLVSKEEGGRITLREMLTPDREDVAIFGRILDAVSKVRYTRP